MAKIDCRDVSVGYGNTQVASGITFAVEAGQLLCVIGPNGVGKSTLVRTLLGLQAPLAGTLQVEGGAGKVGYLPQRSAAERDFPASAEEVVLSGYVGKLGRRVRYSAAEREGARANLAAVGAADLAAQPFGRLSGGQQQRVLLARALCAAGGVLVLDEPTTGLDPQAATDLYAAIERLRVRGMALVMVSHDVDVALAHATHVLRLHPGAAPEFGPVQQGSAGAPNREGKPSGAAEGVAK